MLTVFTSSVISSNTSTCNRRVDSLGIKNSEDLLLLVVPLTYDSKIYKNTHSPQYTYVDTNKVSKKIRSQKNIYSTKQNFANYT